MQKFILSIDQGTTGSTALLVDKKTFKVIDKVNKEFPQIFPKPGLVEHDLNDIWKSVQDSIKEVLSKNSIDSSQIDSIGITNQRETTCAYTKSGKPLANAIVWQDRRTSEFCKNNASSYETLKSKTGLPLDPYFSGTKMRWLLKNSKDVQEALQNDDLLFSTIDTFLLYKLTNGKSFKTEASNASRTLLVDLKTANWDEELLNFFGINKSLLPTVENSFGNFGETSHLDFLPDGIKINCILGDQQAALFGQGGNSKGDLKCTYGTGAFILLNTGTQITYSSNKLLTTIAYKHNGETIYALEGATYIAGAAVQWIRDNLQIIQSAADIEELAKRANLEKMQDLFFLPFFTGIGSPYWNSEARGAILGLSRGTDINEISRACLEGIALAVNDSISALISDVDFKVEEVFVDGGASMNKLLLQIQSNFSGCMITRPEVIETTAYGVALGSLLGSGEISLDQIKKLWRKDITLKPQDDNYYASKKLKWSTYIDKIY